MLIIIFSGLFQFIFNVPMYVNRFFCTKSIINGSFADKCTANNALCTYIKFYFF